MRYKDIYNMLSQASVHEIHGGFCIFMLVVLIIKAYRYDYD